MVFWLNRVSLVVRVPASLMLFCFVSGCSLDVVVCRVLACSGPIFAFCSAAVIKTGYWERLSVTTVIISVSLSGQGHLREAVQCLSPAGALLLWCGCCSTAWCGRVDFLLAAEV